MVPISVLISVKDPNRSHLVSALKSLHEQTFQDFQVIFINDDVHRRNEEYYFDLLQHFFKNFEYVCNDGNKGLTASLNTALRLADGKWIARLDHDDMYLKNKLELQFGYVGKSPVDLVYTAWYWRDETKLVVKNEFRPAQAMNLERLKNENIINGITVLYRKEFALKVGGYSPDMLRCQDWDLWLKMVSNGARTGIVEQPTVIYRWTGKNMTSKYPKDGQYYVDKTRNKFKEI